MTGSEKRDIRELKSLVKSAASSIAMDTAPIPTVSRPVRGKRTSKAVSGFYVHPGTPAKNSAVVFDAVKEAVRSRIDNHEQEQDAIASEVNDPESYDDALSSEEREQLAVSLRAPESTTRNAAGARMTGLEQANHEYAARRGQTIARVS